MPLPSAAARIQIPIDGEFQFGFAGKGSALAFHAPAAVILFVPALHDGAAAGNAPRGEFRAVEMTHRHAIIIVVVVVVVAAAKGFGIASQVSFRHTEIGFFGGHWYQ